jgi:hypothetical protein
MTIPKSLGINRHNRHGAAPHLARSSVSTSTSTARPPMAVCSAGCVAARSPRASTAACGPLPGLLRSPTRKPPRHSPAGHTTCGMRPCRRGSTVGPRAAGRAVGRPQRGRPPPGLREVHRRPGARGAPSDRERPGIPVHDRDRVATANTRGEPDGVEHDWTPTKTAPDGFSLVRGRFHGAWQVKDSNLRRPSRRIYCGARRPGQHWASDL